MEGKDEVVRLNLSQEEQKKNVNQVLYFTALMWQDYLESGGDSCVFERK